MVEAPIKIISAAPARGNPRSTRFTTRPPISHHPVATTSATGPGRSRSATHGTT
ncbi:hypothetical protein NE236_28185 [Actinoallomurus purpureus]|uniref:hypothetical protein n=1 Tax=Actinoallomurus purpureus TaxID=478114 RepID=UPI002093E52B|nr:hypothetical protein [Actinoallomurus purpureus]MCO6008861.1 hypothetical protein [Actinoallomurus purpureus]